jgi:hypothetical protein
VLCCVLCCVVCVVCVMLYLSFVQQQAAPPTTTRHTTTRPTTHHPMKNIREKFTSLSRGTFHSFLYFYLFSIPRHFFNQTYFGILTVQQGTLLSPLTLTLWWCGFTTSRQFFFYQHITMWGLLFQDNHLFCVNYD